MLGTGGRLVADGRTFAQEGLGEPQVMTNDALPLLELNLEGRRYIVWRKRQVSEVGASSDPVLPEPQPDPAPEPFEPRPGQPPPVPPGPPADPMPAPIAA